MSPVVPYSGSKLLKIVLICQTYFSKFFFYKSFLKRLESTTNFSSRYRVTNTKKTTTEWTFTKITSVRVWMKVVRGKLSSQTEKSWMNLPCEALYRGWNLVVTGATVLRLTYVNSESASQSPCARLSFLNSVNVPLSRFFPGIHAIDSAGHFKRAIFLSLHAWFLRYYSH